MANSSPIISPDTMRAIVCSEPGKLQLDTRPRPQSGDGQIRVKTQCIGVCGMDYHIIEGKNPSQRYPRIMGHELSGYAQEESSDGRIAVGDLVVVNPYTACGQCRACKAGKPNACVFVSVFGVHSDGGMCEEFCAPEQNLYLATDLQECAASMVEFLAIGAHAVSRARLEPGSRALVAGAGPIGVGVALFARFAGADVTIRDINQTRLGKATELVPGSHSSLVAGRIPDNEISTFDAVFDVTGNIQSMNAGIHFLAHGGVYVLVSVVKEKLVISDPEFHIREASVLGSRNALKEDFEHVMARMRAGDIPVDALNSHSTQLDDAVNDLMSWVTKRDTITKAIIHV